jgi:hypothetical protein
MNLVKNGVWQYNEFRFSGGNIKMVRKEERERMRKDALAGLILVFALMMAGSMPLPGWAEEKAKAEAPAKEMTIARAVVATGIENLEPVGVAAAFPASTARVYCFLEATQIDQDTEVSLIWFYGSKEMRKLTLPVKAGPRWRTWAYKNLGGQKGDWKVEIKDAQEKFLKDVAFKIE